MQEGGARGFCFPDDCWELIFNKLREDDERFLDSISLVSKQFLSISNLVKLQLQVMDEALHLLPNLLRRFQHIESIVIHADNHNDPDGILDQISQSGLLNLQALKFWGRNKPSKDGFMALALNTNMKNNLKVLDCRGLISIQDNDLILIADLFPRLQKLRISAYNFTCTDEPAAHITDDGVIGFASRLKDMEEIEFEGDAFFITDQSLISLSTNCVNLKNIGLCINSNCPHSVTEDSIGFVMRHSPNLTSLSLNLALSEHSANSFTIENSIIYCKNMHSLTMIKSGISDKLLCSVAKAPPPFKRLVLIGSSVQSTEIDKRLMLLLKTCWLTLEELTLRDWSLTNASIRDLAEYLSKLTYIDLDRNFGLNSITVYTLAKNCPLLGTLKMSYTSGPEADASSPRFLHKNYRLRHLDLSDSRWLNDTTLENFCQVCPNLEFLRVSNCTHLTNVGIWEVLRKCPAIMHLNISGLAVSDIFGRYVEQTVVNLKTLNARGTQIDDKTMTMIGNRCRDLRYLEIECCKEVTDNGVMKVARNCKRLRHVALFGCQNVSTSILPQMVFSSPSLREIVPPRFTDLNQQMLDLLLFCGCRIV